MHGCATRKSFKGISWKDPRKQNNQPISLWIINHILRKFCTERTGGRGEFPSPLHWWYAQQPLVGYVLVLYEFTLTSKTQVPPQTGVLPFQPAPSALQHILLLPKSFPCACSCLSSPDGLSLQGLSLASWQSQKSQPWSTRATEALLMWDPVERQGGRWTMFLIWNQPKTSGFNFRLHCKFLAHLPGVPLAPMTPLQVVTGSNGWCVLF